MAKFAPSAVSFELGIGPTIGPLNVLLPAGPLMPNMYRSVKLLASRWTRQYC
jgi:hypothetical protein